MREFAALYAALDASTSTTAKLQALVDFLGRAPAADAAWAVYLLAGGKPRQAVPTGVMRAAACQAAGIEDWLFEECYQVVGDLAETIAHLLPLELAPFQDTGGDEPATGEGTEASDRVPLPSRNDGLADWLNRGILPLRGTAVAHQLSHLRRMWSVLRAEERFLLTKLVGGGFRVGVSRQWVQRALAQHAGLPVALVAQRMMGYTRADARPSAQDFAALVAPVVEGAATDPSQPYPFFLAHPLDPAQEPQLEAVLGPPEDWLVEWKYDGIRAQVVRRADGVWIWSRGEELVTDRFPEVAQAAMGLPPGTVLDGELLVMPEGPQGRPAAFADLQTRITRKRLTRELLARTPVGFMAYDLLEHEGGDIRALPQQRRRDALEALLAGGPFGVSPLVAGSAWDELQEWRTQSRERGVEGFMLKHRQAAYGVGRRKAEGPAAGSWWKWKVAPMTVDAVLVYAQRGHGRRASVYTDYTFAVWNRPPEGEDEVQAVLQAIARRDPPEEGALQLVTFTKAYSGLSDAEFQRIDAVIRRTTVEKFGPVRSVVPSVVMELGFEGINASTRHRSGLALRFPRMLRIRDDKPLREADTLQNLQRWLRGGDA